MMNEGVLPAIADKKFSDAVKNVKLSFQRIDWWN
jgi:hypothetical protein